ncbi:DNA-directed RNA polymerase subunit [Gregarina niphandrodes]|uniref:DNA-directed RNA polymerase subunit n=1 Tax=Gregarina niphandrodes TaxID=110365 RepID=A0A023B9I4_GRENI|nr:DNA-directed RNA polymerase subunit [Gregarina niphandrodes]EZG72989.1 DNA-directed RNA polymerase subunit [Gregarina niphandrodes]|eukprot:XP_011129684.1 DNA-directed RNA polymerase subunit [Gregarina niphandrodes]
MSEIRFCKECRNVLQPEEDKQAKMLMLVCRTCESVQGVDPEDEQAHFVETITVNLHSAEDVKKYVYPGLVRDPTLPRADDWICPYCTKKGAVYFQLPERVAWEAMTLVYVCKHCEKYKVEGVAHFEY